MAFITTKDGTEIYYKDWGTGQPITFSHGWPLSADAWDAQMMFLADKGYRVIAHDRRGHGRSSQPWDGNNMDQYADDLAELIEHLDLKDTIMVGHSTGGGEVARYIGRHGTSRVAKAILISAVPPIMLKTETNPGGLTIDVFDGLRKSVHDDRSQFFIDLSMPFYGYNKEGAKLSEGVRQSFWLQGMLMSIKGAYDCIKQFSETDFNEDLKKIDVPTLVLHGDADQIVPIGSAGLMTAKIVKDAKLKVYPGFPHGMCTTEADIINADILAFLEVVISGYHLRMVPPLETARLLLRPLQLADAEQVQRIFPHWGVVEFLANQVPWPYPADGALTHIRDASLPAMQRGEEWHWTLRLKTQPDEIIGGIGLYNNTTHNRGFWLGVPWQRQGLMTEAAEVVTSFWFNDLGFPILRVPKAVANTASRRISEAGGMRIVSREEKDYVSGRLPSETWEITADEWRNASASTRLD